MAHCLRTWGTTVPPKQDHQRPIGRPRKMTEEMLEELRQYVDHHPLASLRELQTHIEGKFNTDCGRPSISRRLKEMGYSLSIVSRGATSAEKENLPELSREDNQRLIMDPTAGEAMSNGSGSVYAWLRNSKPVPRRTGPREKKAKKTSGEKPALESVTRDGGTPESIAGLPVPELPAVTQPTFNGSAMPPPAPPSGLPQQPVSPYGLPTMVAQLQQLERTWISE